MSGAIAGEPPTMFAVVTYEVETSELVAQAMERIRTWVLAGTNTAPD